MDCDAIYHELLRTDGALREAIAGAFGPVFAADGGLDRQKLGNLVFGDPAALETLNGIIYARLPRELRRRMDASDAAVVGIDAINLIESGLDGLCRRTVAGDRAGGDAGGAHYGAGRHTGGIRAAAGAGTEGRSVLPGPLHGRAGERLRQRGGLYGKGTAGAGDDIEGGTSMSEEMKALREQLRGTTRTGMIRWTRRSWRRWRPTARTTRRS